MGDYGIKVSKDGVDVKSATPLNLAVSSAFNSYKVLSQGAGSVSVAKNNGTATVTIAHNLGYAPSYWFWHGTVHANTMAVSMSLTIDGGASGGVGVTKSYTDSTNLKVFFINTSTTDDYTVPYYYFIFYDQAS